jgi:hypothetical protein
MRKFFEVIQLVNEPQQVKTDCGDFTVINTGTSNAILNGLTIASGDQYVARANEGELNVTQYTLGFDNTGTNQVTVIRKIYQ